MKTNALAGFARKALASVVLFASLVLPFLASTAAAKPVRVVIWDEQQPVQKEIYPNFIGNHLADFLRTKKGFSVVSVRLDDPEQGLSKEVLDNCDVLVWWGHVRHHEIKSDKARDIVKRIKSGQISFLALHAAHFSAPFIEAMDERARDDAFAALQPGERATAILKESNLLPGGRGLPAMTSRLSPGALYEKAPGKPVTINLTLANCAFPAVRADGKPCAVRILLPNHPIAKNVSPTFTLDQTEMYAEPFHVPTPDAVIFDQRWDSGEWFRGGCVWSLGKGKIFYFQPGHETYGNFKDLNVLQIIENAARWLGQR